MTKTAWVHIGSPKTGTKSIQTFMSGNRSRLKKCNVLYPGKELWHARLGSFCSDSNPRYIANVHGGFDNQQRILELDKNWIRAIRSEVAESDANNLVFSYEGLFQPNEKRIRALKEFFSGIASKIVIIAYVREPVSQVSSEFGTNALHGFPSGYKPRRRPVPNVLEMYRAVFGKASVIVRPFERDQLKGLDLTEDFMSSIGVSSEDFARLEPLNESKNEGLSKLAVKFLRMAKSELGDNISNREFHKTYGGIARQIPGPKFRFEASDISDIIDELNNDAKYLEKEFLIYFKNPH